MAATAIPDLYTQTQGSVAVEREDLMIADDLLIARARDRNQVPLLCFPRSEQGTTEYDKFTGKDIDRMVDHAAKHLLSHGLRHDHNKSGKPPVITLLGATDLCYIVTFFALARLGYTSLCLSPRLAPNACAKLIEETSACAMIPGKTAQMASLVAETQKLLEKPIDMYKMVGRGDFDKPGSKEPRYQRDHIDRGVEKNWTLAILHSSGSTGLPKPIYLPHKRLMMKIPPPKGQIEFNTFPFFHGYGSWAVVHGMMDRKTMYMYNPNIPMTADYCIKVLEHIRPDVLHVVPYTLELLALSERGVDAMASCQRVVFSGSGCPDDVGNDLVSKGVNVENSWGATEMGNLGHSFNRAPGDNAWDYIRIPPPVAKFIWMKPLGDDTYECVYLHGLPALVVSNSDDPPKSFHSRDVFIKHSSLVAWKHIGRLDDRITLSNGEKVLPLPIEGRVRLNPLVRECCVFGAGNSIPGILVFRNEDSKDMAEDDFITAIWATIQKANRNTESFSQISKETIVPLPAEVDYPKTDKESIKRAQIYHVFAKDMNAMYERLEYTGTGTLQFSIPQIKEWLLNIFSENLGVKLPNVEYDFFAAGINSLQAIQIRGLILKHIDLGGNSRKLCRNVVFDTSNVARLAKYLHALRLKEVTPSDDRDEIEEMQAMIERYSTFKAHIPGSAPTPDGRQTVVLTGATGSLGAYILARLLNRSNVHHVYCLVRGESPQKRVLSALQQRQLSISDTTLLTALTSDLGRPDLGLSEETYQELSNVTTTIIHSAWAVNFNIGLRTFEAQHIAGVTNLIQLSLSVQTLEPARFFFCSSIAVALGTPAPATISEGPIQDLGHALQQGYARSKLVSEHIVSKAAIDAGARTRILRIGQIVGDKEQGIWNDTEAIPLIIRSALTLKVLPALNETESWLPVDTLATTILDLAGITTPLPGSDSNKDLIYNLQNPRTFSWTHILLPALANAGLAFTTVSVNEWLQELRDYEENGGDMAKNPAVKLIDHFESLYGGKRKGEGRAQVCFEIRAAVEHSEGLREAPNLVEDGSVGRFVENWLRGWEGGESVEVERSSYRYE